MVNGFKCCKDVNWIGLEFFIGCSNYKVIEIYGNSVFSVGMEVEIIL